MQAGGRLRDRALAIKRILATEGSTRLKEDVNRFVIGERSVRLRAD